MLRSSLSDRRRSVPSTCCRWFMSIRRDSRSTQRQQQLRPIASTYIKSDSTNSLCIPNSPTNLNRRPRYYQSSCPLWSPTEHFSRRTTSLPSSRTISAKPFYDFLEHGDDDSGDDHFADDVEQDNSEYVHQWMKDNKHDNNIYLHEFRAEKSEVDHKYSEDDSLLNLLNGDSVDYYEDEAPRQSRDTSHTGNDDLRLLLNNSDEYSQPSYVHPTHNNLNGYSNNEHRIAIDPMQRHQVDDKTVPLIDILNDETKEIDMDAKRNELHRLQLQLETESIEDAILKCLEVWNAARDRSDYDTVPVVRRTLASWYGPLSESIELEQWLYLNNDNETNPSKLSVEEDENEDPSSSDTQNSRDEVDTSSHRRLARDRSVYGPLLCLLPPTKIAVILAHTSLSTLLTSTFVTVGYSKVVSLALTIADVLETELNVSRALRVRANERKRKLNITKKEEDGNNNTGGMPRPQNHASDTSNQQEVIPVDGWVYSATHLQRFLDEIAGNKGANGQQALSGIGKYRPHTVRKRCKEILLAEGYVANGVTDSEGKEKLSMSDFADWDPVMKVKLGAALIRLLLDHTTFSKPLKHGFAPPEPAFRYSRHMNKHNATKAYGCISIHPELLRIAVQEEFSATSAFIPASVSSARVQPMVIPPKDWKSINDGGYETVKVPFMRTRHCKVQTDALHRADLSQLMAGLNVLGKTPWKVNQKILEVAMKCWDDGIALGDIPSRVDNEVPPLPESMAFVDYKTLGDFEQKEHVDAYRKYRERVTKHNRAKQKNMDLHSLRCSAMLKLNQAQRFKDFSEIYFPYNVDFRGRAYPVPPHFSIVGSDLCRGLLMFAHPKPLGRNGLYWLKVHLANLAGADKMSFDGRARFADENIDNIYAAVNDPFGGNDWWMKFEDPFQGLAACHEIVQAIDSGDPENYMCSYPVHMDGSCNGLQHYAALGRDRGGGKAVNLCVSDEPQDVYIGVMHEVIRRVAIDADEVIPFDETKSDLSKAEKEMLKRIKSARLVNGLIDRGVVKRTVMTSVYGVTFIGAKNQISEKIEQKLEAKGYDLDEIESEIHTACGYLAALTMEVMGQQFKGARETMNWLTECARLIAAHEQPVSFISPIGVPVVQPYRQRRLFIVTTLLQNVIMFNDSDLLPLHRQRQVSAFPPNYVHSLDSSHMLLTAIEMNKRDLYFSAVHDSYWTHPCDIEEMNVILRESFIELYNRPLLEELRNTWSLRYPSVTFPDVPERGDLDLNDVRSAPYFFQ